MSIAIAVCQGRFTNLWKTRDETGELLDRFKADLMMYKQVKIWRWAAYAGNGSEGKALLNSRRDNERTIEFDKRKTVEIVGRFGRYWR
ncbi:hypothetical protein IAE29_20665 [Ochrobactrum sp. S46]|nr:hypothetical protein [Ochrobactrum sp. S46]